MGSNILNLRSHALRLAEFHVEVKSIEGDDDLRVRGYASTNDVDRYEDIVEPSAFKSTMDYYMKNGIVLLDHDPSQRIGLPVDYEITDKGLVFEAKIMRGFHPLDVRERARTEMQQGILKAFSIGFRILSDEAVPRGNKSGRRRIKELELFEISAVGIPANRSTMFSVVKGLSTGSDAPIDLYNRGLFVGNDETDGDDKALARLRESVSNLNAARRNAR
jgi:hypothetical protein